jgi:outer membrane protein TolC
MAVLLTCQQAKADYGAMVREMDSYQPPAVVAGQMRAQPPLIAPLMPTVDPFAEQIAVLKAQQAIREQAMVAPSAADAFIRPDPGRLAALQPTAENDEAAAKALADGFTLETLEILVLLRSPEIKAKEAEYRAVLAGYSQVENLDTILRRYASFTKSVMTGVGGMTNPDPVAWKFPFPGVLALKGEVVGQEATAALHRVEQSRREAVTAVRRDLAELRYQRQALGVTRSQLALLATLRHTVATRYQAGRGTFQDLTALGIAQEKLREEVTTLVEGVKTTEAALRAALLLPEGLPIGRPTDEALRMGLAPIVTLNDLALERRQEIRVQQAMIARAERLLELAETMVYPGFSQGLSLFEGDELSRVKGEGVSPAGGMTGTEAAFALTTPADSGGGLPKMPWYGTDDATLRQLRQRIASLRLELSAIRAATVLGVRKGWASVDKAKREVALYRDRVVPLVRANLDSATQGYAAGKVEFAALIQATTTWLTVHLTQARAEADLCQAQAELDAAVGCVGPGCKGRGPKGLGQK